MTSTEGAHKPARSAEASRIERLLDFVPDVGAGGNGAGEALHLYRAIIAATALAVVSVGRDHRIESWNSSAERLYGYAAREMIGEQLERLAPDSHRSELTWMLNQALGGEHVRRMATIRRCRDGSTFDAWSTMSPIRDATGAIVGAVSVSDDISEQMNAERELQRALAELARSNADLEQFAYVASHDLSEPLRTVSGFLELLEGRHGWKLDQEAEAFVARARSGVARMRELLDGLLAYSRVAIDEESVEGIDCGSVVTRVIMALDSKITEAGAEIEVGDLPRVRCDPTQLEQLFQNLVANALKFRGDAPPRIRIDAEATIHGTAVSVVDNGIGIAPEHRERIFRMFERLNSRDAYDGIGAGLAICHKIVTRHSGRIWVESPHDGGSRFRFVLPPDNGTATS